jgi:cytochrome b subunit of formate dehydrogenase
MAIANGVPKARNPGVRLKRLARISAWALLACVIVQGISGWGITQTGIINKMTFGLIDRRLANAIHRAAVLPLAFFFLLHVLINIRLTITGKRPRTVRLLSWILAAIGACVLGLVAYLEYFRLGG